MLKIITYCKGREEHLKQCLESLRMCQLPKEHDITIIDYNSNTTFHYPAATTFHADVPKNYFNLPHARNLGVKKSRPKNGDILLIMDCDILYPDRWWIKTMFENYQDGCFYSGYGAHDACGTVMVKYEYLLAVKGYNEDFGKGWGFDDIDFYNRLEAYGINRLPFPKGIESIKHSDNDRVRFYDEKSLENSNFENSNCKTFSSIFE